MKQVLDEVVLQIESDINGGQLDQARDRIELALFYYPANKKLLKLQKKAG